jgi:parallel beta-helix repeat protein
MGEYTIRDNPIVKGLLIGVILFISGVGSPCAQGLSESTINLPEDQTRVKQVYLNHEPILSHRIKEIESHYLLLKSWSFLSRKDDGRLRLGQLTFIEGAQISSPLSFLERTGNYTPHDPIWIDGDNQFTSDNGVVGGSGTIDDPYRIEGWEINGSEDSIAIWNTRSYFLVTNCLLEGSIGLNLVDVTNGTVQSNFLTHGLSIHDSVYVTINNNTLQGVALDNVTYTTITNCNGRIYSQGSSYLTLSNLEIIGYEMGIEFYYTNHTILRNCIVSSNNYGILFYNSPFLYLRDNRIYNNTINLNIEGLKNEDFYHDIDTSNTINGKPISYIYNAKNLVFDETSDSGFLGFVNCTNITIKNIVLTNCGVGVLFVATQNSSIISCEFADTLHAIGLFCGSQNNIIFNCTSFDAEIYLYGSPNNLLRNNSVNNFWVEGNSLSDFYQDIDSSNTIGGRPIYYLVGKKNMIFRESDVGFLALIDCENILVSNIVNANQGLLVVRSRVIIRHCDFNHHTYGIFITNNSQTWICESKVSNNIIGIMFDRSSSTTVLRCKITENLVGSHFEKSNNIIIRNCDIVSNAFSGIQIANSWNNILCLNNISDNGMGISMWGDCYNNEFCDNRIWNENEGFKMHPDYDIDPSLGPHDNQIHHNSISAITYWGFFLVNSEQNTIHHNSISNCKYAMDFFYCGLNTVQQNNIFNNEEGIDASKSTIDAEKNWWGAEDGPSGIGPGSGDSIFVYNSNITFEPWLHHPAITKPSSFRSLLTCILARVILHDRQ